MATVVITFFLLVRFYVYKMDAEFIDRPRSGELSRREKRWSMNSQRLEEIVAELMKPIGDVRRSFDTDLSALLEEYLTEAGLHALEAGEGGAELAAAAAAAPNFAELALLLQHSASLYGRKVDCLYQHVLSVSDSLLNTSQELERAETEVTDTGAAAGRARLRERAGGGGGGGAGAGWRPIELVAAGAAAREAGRAQPPPTLPRVYLELEPRAREQHERALADYGGEPLGLPRDYHVLWRLQGGMLVDELEQRWGSGRSLRPIPLMELQAALAAAAPPPLPAPPPAPLHAPHLRDDSPPRLRAPLHASTPLPPPPRERKRKHDGSLDVFTGRGFKLLITEAGRKALSRHCEFSVEPWASSVLALRARHIRTVRRATSPHTDFHGFESSEIDIGGFVGWSSSEVTAAAAAAATAATATTAATTATTATAATTHDGDSDDDGFFEQSSLGDSDGSRPDDTAPHDNSWWSWQLGVVSRAAARGPAADVRALAARLLATLATLATLPTLPTLPGAPPDRVAAPQLFAAAGPPHDLPALFLASLFLANAGNVEIIQGPPLTVNSFSVQYVTDDPRKYCAADLDSSDAQQ